MWKEKLGLNVLYICGYDVTCVKFKTLQLHITSLKLFKTPQNLQGSFSIKLIKIFNKNRGEVSVSDPL